MLHCWEASSVFIIINSQYASHCKFACSHCYSAESRHIQDHCEKICDSVKSEEYL